MTEYIPARVNSLPVKSVHPIAMMRATSRSLPALSHSIQSPAVSPMQKVLAAQGFLRVALFQTFYAAFRSSKLLQSNGRLYYSSGTSPLYYVTQDAVPNHLENKQNQLHGK